MRAVSRQCVCWQSRHCQPFERGLLLDISAATPYDMFPLSKRRLRGSSCELSQVTIEPGLRLRIASAAVDSSIVVESFKLLL